MAQDKDFFTVKDVAEMLDTEAYVLRFYEKELNLSIRRNSKGHRVYTLEDVEMFRQIQDMREQGLQLKAIEGIVHDSTGEVKETYEQLTSTGLTPAPSKKNDIMGIDISDSEDDKVKQFFSMMKEMYKQAMLEYSDEFRHQVKDEIKQEVEECVEEKISKLEELQNAKNEEYYKKLDEAMREIQRMRKELNEDKEKEEDKKTKVSLWGKLFRGKSQGIEL